MSGADNGKALAFLLGDASPHTLCGTGLTKREMFAAMAMQGLLAAEANVKIMDCAHEAGTGLPTRDLVPIVEQRLARTCVRLADALLAELAKEPAP